MKALRVVALQIRDVLGVREFSMTPGQVTCVSGKNASGKSSLLASVQAALGRGSLAKLARIDPGGVETEPEVCLVLEGQGEHYRIERTGEKVRVRRRVGDTAGLEDVPRPQEFLAGLYDGVASSPVRFLLAPDKERALLLLEALTLTMDRAALLERMDVKEDELPAIPDGLHPLMELEMIRDSVFRMRTGVNRDAKGKAQAAEQTRRNAPADIPADPAKAIAAVEGRVAEVAEQLGAAERAAQADHARAVADAQSTHDIEEQRVQAAFTETVRAKRAAHEQKAAELRAETERVIVAERETVEVDISALRACDETRLDALDKDLRAERLKADTARNDADGALAEMRATVTKERERLATLRQQADTSAKARALHEQAKQFDEEAARLDAEAERLTGAIDALDDYRRQLAEDLPIAGLTIDGQLIRVNGVPFDQLNTATKVAIAVKVATLRAKGNRLPCVFVDGAEALDAEHFDLLCKELAEAGVQAFVAAVRDQPLTVEAIA